MIKVICITAVAVIVLTAGRLSAQFQVIEDEKQIKISTPELNAAVNKKGYVTGIASGSFLDKKSGFHDPGFGLDIVDWIMEEGSDEAYRPQLDPELVYKFNNPLHGKTAKRSIEGPQICTRAGQIDAKVIKGPDWLVVKQQYQYHTAAPGKKTGSTWEQNIVLQSGKRFFIS